MRLLRLRLKLRVLDTCRCEERMWCRGIATKRPQVEHL